MQINFSSLPELLLFSSFIGVELRRRETPGLNLHNIIFHVFLSLAKKTLISVLVVSLTFTGTLVSAFSKTFFAFTLVASFYVCTDGVLNGWTSFLTAFIYICKYYNSNNTTTNNNYYYYWFIVRFLTYQVIKSALQQ